DVCFNTYGVKFPMFSSVAVRGKGAHPLFLQLAQATGQSPGWNFNKYLVDRQGKVIAHFGSTTSPTSGSLTSAIEKALAGG
ncbi:MAG: glutathione peroxidase, partial [Rubrivivax sp.]|nr:glutathione peroxidase [Rubrivivax sp.]